MNARDEYQAKLAADKAEGQRQADAWNAQHPVGTHVMAYPGIRPDDPVAVAYQKRVAEGRTFASIKDPCKRLKTTTRSVAWTLGHGEPVVMVAGYAGGICLTHVDVIPRNDTVIEERLLTADTYYEIDTWLDKANVFAKAYTESRVGRVVTTGLRIGEKPGHVVAKFGDTIVRHADGSHTVRPADEAVS